ncbi:MAG: sodium:proton antiporter [Janthinobacterium lividum]
MSKRLPPLPDLPYLPPVLPCRLPPRLLPPCLPFLLLFSLLLPSSSQAATMAPTTFGAWWALPFAGLLLSIAVMPLLAAPFWHRHDGKLAAAWSLAFLLPCAWFFGPITAGSAAMHALAGEFLPFVILICALYVVAGGICLHGRLPGTPVVNCLLLLAGTLLASVMGTTGASMLMIRPLIRANARRRKAGHIIVFFIFLVANAGGALTPLGDPPLFIGFLKGVDFFWTLRRLFPHTLFACASLLLVFLVLDTWFYRREPALIDGAAGPAGGRQVRRAASAAKTMPATPRVSGNAASDRASDIVLPSHAVATAARTMSSTTALPASAGSESPSKTANAGRNAAASVRFRVEGSVNFLLLAVVILLVLLSGFWQPGQVFSLAGTPIELQNLVRDAGLLLVIGASLYLTPPSARSGNAFSWAPMLEVARLFAAIFITITPVIAMLRAGVDGPFAFVIHGVTAADGQPSNVMYFWATGLLSAFLDNAPTYLVFFNSAGGDAQLLMNRLPETLAAISCGAVFMGAGSYIGNAPNMMVKSIAEQQGIRMPSFFGYMGWSCVVLLPLFILMSMLFFR